MAEGGFRFGAVSTRAIRDPNVTPHMLRVLAEIATFADADGWCEVRQGVMADHLTMSQQAVSKHVRGLVAAGHLLVEQRFGDDGSRRANRYCVRLDPPTTPEVVGPTTLGVAGPTTPEVVARTDLGNRPREQTGAATASPPPRGSKNARTSPVANDLTRGWWDALDKKPIGSTAFVAARGIVQAALDKDWSPEQVRDALARCEPPMVGWKLEEALRRGRRGSGGIDLDAMSR